MEQLLPVFLLLLFAALPAALFPSVQRKLYIPGALLFAAAAACLLPLTFSPCFFICAVLLGAYLYLTVCRRQKQGRGLCFCLCWGMGLAVLGVGHALRIADFPSLGSMVLLLLALVLGLGFGLVLRFLFREEIGDMIPLSEEQKLSPVPLLLTVLVCELLLLLFGGDFPSLCIALSALLELLLLLLLALWNNMSLAVERSRESSAVKTHSRRTADQVNRSSDAELWRRLTESNNKLLRVSLAYHSKDEAELAALLGPAEEQGSVSYSSYPLLDAVLRHRAYEERRAGITPNFRLLLGTMKGFSLSDVGVLLDMMLALMGECHPGKQDVLRLRVQEWGDALILVLGRRDCLRTVPEEQMNAMRRLTEQYGGFLELAEREGGLRLSAVLFRPPTE